MIDFSGSLVHSLVHRCIVSGRVEVPMHYGQFEGETYVDGDYIHNYEGGSQMILDLKHQPHIVTKKTAAG